MVLPTNNRFIGVQMVEADMGPSAAQDLIRVLLDRQPADNGVTPELVMQSLDTTALRSAIARYSMSKLANSEPTSTLFVNWLDNEIVNRWTKMYMVVIRDTTTVEMDMWLYPDLGKVICRVSFKPQTAATAESIQSVLEWFNRNQITIQKIQLAKFGTREGDLFPV